MTFKEIVGAKDQKETLRSLVDDESIPHALLISGVEGNSKLALAYAYISYLMCENKTDGDACGSCRACAKTTKFVHPDVHFSFPFYGASSISDEYIKSWRKFLSEKPYAQLTHWLHYIDGETKKANINTKECRSIIHKLNMQSFESNNKVLLMWLPEFLGKEGNRLLKLIEEPTDNTYFVFVTEKTDDILPTIISRCQHIKIPPLQDEEIMQFLIENQQVSEEKARNVSFIAEGNIQKAIEIISQDSHALSEEILSWFRICYSSKAEDFVTWVDSFAKKSKDEQKTFLHYALNFFREIARVNLLPENQLRIQEKEIQTAKKIAGIINFEKIEKLNNILTDTIYYIERNANIKVLMMETNISFKNVLRSS